jgi:SpoIID/LytB domain protein
LIHINHEPTVAVGLLAATEAIRFELHGAFIIDSSGEILAGNYQAAIASDAQQITITDAQGKQFTAPEITLRPVNDITGSFTVHDIIIGVNFHWERRETQTFRGALRLKGDGAGKLLVINDVSVEQYLVSVISSEMSASAHHELLKAHAIISRSWLLAQLAPWKVEREKFLQLGKVIEKVDGTKELIRWYDKENHRDFDVCADDHCQRYQGITKALKTIEGALGQEKVRSVIQTTFGRVLTFDDDICDARFSKSCGGMVEQYASAWEDAHISYLTPLYDGETFPSEFALPLTNEKNAEAWITAAPAAFCNSNDRTILQRILPDFDQETTDFYRWHVTIPQTELQALLHKKLSIEFGAVHSLEPVERGASGRLTRLRITGEKITLVLGKELEIRRALSPSHLYSSAFVIRPEFHGGNIPASFTLIGAGWGHGVGLCQIGAALMAEAGYVHENILAHYYPGSSLHKLY